MKTNLVLLVMGLFVLSSMSFGEERRNDRRGNEVLRTLRDNGVDLIRNRRGERRRNRRGERRRNNRRGEQRRSQLYKDYSGAIAAGNYCEVCSFENRADTPRTGRRRAPDRFLVNNDAASVNRRCRELGWDYGQVLQTYSYREWCRYGNAKTRSWDSYGRRWNFGRCTNGNVKKARCFRY